MFPSSASSYPLGKFFHVSYDGYFYEHQQEQGNVKEKEWKLILLKITNGGQMSEWNAKQ